MPCPLLFQVPSSPVSWPLVLSLVSYVVGSLLFSLHGPAPSPLAPVPLLLCGSFIFAKTNLLIKHFVVFYLIELLCGVCNPECFLGSRPSRSSRRPGCPWPLAPGLVQAPWCPWLTQGGTPCLRGRSAGQAWGVAPGRRMRLSGPYVGSRACTGDGESWPRDRGWRGGGDEWAGGHLGARSRGLAAAGGSETNGDGLAPELTPRRWAGLRQRRLLRQASGGAHGRFRFRSVASFGCFQSARRLPSPARLSAPVPGAGAAGPS